MDLSGRNLGYLWVACESSISKLGLFSLLRYSGT